MSKHRMVCTVLPPEIEGMILLDQPEHKHACIHDSFGPVLNEAIEHECKCSMTWIEYPPEA